MSKHTAEARSHVQLRTHAEVLLKGGTAPPTQGWTTGAQALALLHRLASASASASDALKLLHELQVHQVELDLQHEQLELNRRELTEQLERCAELYDFAPFGYCTVDLEGRIIQGNLAGAVLLGTERESLIGRRIDSFLASESRPLLSGLLSRVRESGKREASVVRCNGGGDGPRALQMVAAISPDGRAFLVGLMDTAGG